MHKAPPRLPSELGQCRAVLLFKNVNESGNSNLTQFDLAFDFVQKQRDMDFYRIESLIIKVIFSRKFSIVTYDYSVDFDKNPMDIFIQADIYMSDGYEGALQYI